MSEYDDDYLLSIFKNDTPELVCCDKFIGDDNLQRIIERMVQTSSKASRLILRGNCLSSKSGTSIARLLKSDLEVEFISLEWNQLRSGVADIAEALLVNTSLKHLDLRNNGISDIDISNFAEVLVHNRTLRILDLRWNLLSDKGVDVFKDSVMNRSPPLVVHFSGNNISPHCTNQLDEWVTRKSTGDPLTASLTEQSVDRNCGMEESLPTQQNILLQTKVQLSCLQKELQSMRQQNTHLQSTVSSLEGQLCSDATRTTELEQALMSERYRSEQLKESLKNLSENHAGCGEENKRLVADWQADREKYTGEMSGLLREREAELRMLTRERDALRELLAQTESGYSREREQQQSLWAQQEAEIAALKEQLKSTQLRASEMVHENTLLKLEVSNSQSIITRLNEKLLCIEEESLLSQQTAEESLLAEMRRHDAELASHRSEAAVARAQAEARSRKLNEEVEYVRSRGLEAERLLGRELADTQAECDARVEQAREAEKQRMESVLNDLRHRLELSLAARDEVDKRCNQYLNETKIMAKQHDTVIAQIKTQMEEMNTELTRLRTNDLVIRTSLAACQSDANNRLLELNSLRTQLTCSEEEGSQAKSAVLVLTGEKQSLQRQLVELQTALDFLRKQRSQGFDAIEQAMKDCVSKELEILRAKLVPQTMGGQPVTS